MSEYLSKKAVLEWLDDRRYKSPWIESFRERLESGAFDAEQTCTQENPCPECLKKSVDGYKLIESELNTEIQRLRAALEMAQSELRWGDPTNAIERVERIIDEALSTTTEQAERVKPFQQRLVELTIEENKRIYKDGINAPEKEDEFE